jgi:hypothetical protein
MEKGRRARGDRPCGDRHRVLREGSESAAVGTDKPALTATRGSGLTLRPFKIRGETNLCGSRPSNG